MIPKIIHYCWFGRGDLPKSALKCIDSWRRFLPDYQIKVWNEDNFDVNVCPYVAEAYGQRKYAFVSDYARFWALYNYGGVYFDTDVEVVASMDRILSAGPFMGIEKSLFTNGLDPQGEIGVNPGLGYAAEPDMPLLGELLDYYNCITFDITAGTIVYHTTKLLKKYGLRNVDELQHVAGFNILPADYLCPMDSTTGVVTRTRNTVSIHHYSCSWMDHNTLSFRLHLLKNKLISIFGSDFIMKVSKLIKK